MKRHRQQQLGVGENLAAGAVHPAPERAGEMRVVAMLEHQRQAAAVAIVAHHRPRPVPAGLSARAVGADGVVTHRMRERHAARRAPRRREEGHRRPAMTAQRTLFADARAARQAARRQHAIDDGAAQAAQLGRKGCGELHRHPSSSRRITRQYAIRMDRPDQSAAALFDRRAWRAHRERAARRGAVGFLHDEVAERLIDRLDLVNREFAVALDLGARGGELARRLARRDGTRSLVRAEPAAGFFISPVGAAVAADPELIPFRDASFDLVASCLALHWCADLPGALIQLRRALKPDGLLLAAMFGGNTLVELRTALFEAELAEEGGVSPRVSPTAELGDAASLLQRAGFAMPVADSETITVTYPDMLALLHDLRGMGETNALAARRRFLSRATLARAGAIYAERFAGAHGRIPATFEVLFLTGWTPHPDHAAPRPGPRRRIG
jgi:NADH dehydrogenase [ubiquinone] 1 alpha subcomplex assembly factor 5